MKKMIMKLLVISLVVMTGCDNDEEPFSRYPSLSIPEYKTDDYIRSLSDSDPEVIYNAICNLGTRAAGFSNTLWGETPDPDSKAYQDAQSIYSGVCAQLMSKEPMMVAVSLRFLQKFAQDKAARTELIDPVCGIKSSNPLVQFEQVKLLGVLVNETTRLPEPLLRRLMNSESLIVSGATYELMGTLPDDRYRVELLKRYQTTDDEIKRLLLLSEYGKKSNPADVEFFEQEMFSTASPKIRQCALGLILSNINSPDVQAWLNDNFLKFSSGEQERLFEATNDIEDSEAGLELIRQILVRGYDPGDECLRSLVSTIEFMRHETFDETDEDDLDECREHLAKLERVILSFPELEARIKPMREEELQKYRRYAAIQVEYEPLSKEFAEKAQALLTKHGVPEPEQQKLLKAIPGLDQLESVRAVSF